jgi:hypothetical protein
MDKNQPYFDPYNFNMQGIPMQNEMPQALEPMQNIMGPSMYYEQQYMYYKYLTQMLEYKMKLKEYEKMNRDIK